MEAQALIEKDGIARATGVSAPVPWWSFTKTVLAITLLRLSEDGRIDLDEVVDGKPYTPAQLLRHEAGLPDYGTLESYRADVEAGRSPWPIDDLLRAVEADRLRFEPGHGWAYSNIGYWEVARLIERASDLPLGEALAKFVFGPAELASARLVIIPDDLESVRMGDAARYHPGWVYHGLAVGTLVDAAQLLHRLFAGKLVKPGSLSRMLNARPLPQFQSPLHPDPAYGFGLMLSATNPLDRPIGHSGHGPGSRIAVYFQHKMTCAAWSTASDADPEGEVFRRLRSGGS